MFKKLHPYVIMMLVVFSMGYLLHFSDVDAGEKKKIYEMTRSGFHLGLDSEGEEAIIHSQKFVLVDGNADIRGYYDSEDEEAMKKLVQDARMLQSELTQ